MKIAVDNQGKAAIRAAASDLSVLSSSGVAVSFNRLNVASALETELDGRINLFRIGGVFVICIYLILLQFSEG